MAAATAWSVVIFYEVESILAVLGAIIPRGLLPWCFCHKFPFPWRDLK